MSIGNLCQISVKSTDAINSHSDFCEVTPKTFMSTLPNSSFNLDSVHDLLENSVINFLKSNSLSCINSLIKKTIVCRKYHFAIVYTDCINKCHFRSATAVCNATLVMEKFCYHFIQQQTFCTHYWQQSAPATSAPSS